jgi:hypothetical protein
METNNGYTSTMQRPGALQAPNNMMLVQEEPRGPSQLIEIPVNANGLQKIVLPDVQQLRSQVGQVIIVKAIRLIPPAVLTNAPTIGGVNAPLTELVKISLVVYCEGWEKAQLIPILTLCDQFIEGSGTPYREKTTRFNNWRNVDWSKSYLQYSNGTPTAGTPYSVLLEVEYIKLDAQGHEIIGPS